MNDFKNGYEDGNIVENLMEWLTYLKKSYKIVYKRVKAYADNINH